MSSGFDSNGVGSDSGFRFDRRRPGGRKSKQPKKTRNFNGVKVFGKFFAYFVTFLFIVVVAFFSGFFGGWLNDYLKIRKSGLDVGFDKVRDDVVDTKVNVVDNSDVEALVAKALPSIVGVVVPVENSIINKSLIGDHFPFNIFPFISITGKEKVKSSGAAIGSGFSVKVNGEKYIITNHHVVKDFVRDEILERAQGINEYIYIVLKNDDSSLKRAKVVGYDAGLDIAVLQMVDYDTSKMPCLEFAKPNSTQVGGLAIAMGTPLTGKHITVTRGIVSGYRKFCMDSGVEVPVVQTDAAINPGNSGGPLLDCRGNVLGIVAMKNITQEGESLEGMNYAIYGPEAYKTICEIVQKGTKNKGTGQLSLGISVFDDNSSLSKYFGVVIDVVSKGSPAEKAGLRAGDVIASVDGVKVSSVSEWQNELAKKKPGNKIELVIVRRGKSYRTEVVAGSA